MQQKTNFTKIIIKKAYKIMKLLLIVALKTNTSNLLDVKRN